MTYEWNPWSCVICGWFLPVCGRHACVFKHVGTHVHISIGKLKVARNLSRSLSTLFIEEALSVNPQLTDVD